MEVIVFVLMFLAIFGGAVLSLAVRRRNPGVGAVSGSLVLILILLGFGWAAWTTLIPPPGDEGPVSTPDELGRSLVVLIALVGVAGRIGAFQGTKLKMPPGVAWLGGVGQLIPLSLVLLLIRPQAPSDNQISSAAFSVTEATWASLCLACVGAELLAPWILAKRPRRRQYPRTFDVPPPY